MHPTKTTAKVLVGMAAWAATGCVSVEAQPGPLPPSVAVTGTEHVKAPQIVEGPAREALEAALPHATPTPRPSRTQGPPAPRTPAAEPAARPTVPDVPGGPGLPDVRQSALPSFRPLPLGRKDLCALGEEYAGVRPDSPLAGFCRDASGH
ncbi:hypothetical protein [Streptomyces sp. NPDC058572]|uniref:hypothetical protein n=1 Tax=Streptomyces sp. NPDC058572 TaxID=3346546 RepID=UPI003664BF6B